jgi:hypothetical protein
MERVMIVCDDCGATPATPVLVRANGRNHALDLCAAHLGALLKKARAPKRGRPRGVRGPAKVPSATASKRTTQPTSAPSRSTA